MLLLLINGRLVGGLIKQAIGLGGIADLNLSDPGITLGALVDELRLVFEDNIWLHDRAGDGREDVRGRLDGLHGTDGLAGAHFEAGLGELNEHNITKGLGGVFCDADLSCRGGYPWLV